MCSEFTQKVTKYTIQKGEVRLTKDKTRSRSGPLDEQWSTLHARRILFPKNNGTLSQINQLETRI